MGARVVPFTHPSGGRFFLVYDDVTNETTDIIGAAVKFADHFIGPQIRTTAAGVDGWTVKDTAGATEALVANKSAGIVSLNLAAGAEKEEAGLYYGDALNFNIDKGIIFEARAAVHTAPTDQAELYFGFANAYVEGPIAEADAGPTVHAFFCFDGGLAAKVFTDDAVTDNDAKATGVTVVADEFHVFKIEILSPTDVRFYIDRQRVAGSVVFDMSNGTDIVLQPFVMAHKEAGTGVGSLYVDYVKAWQLTV
jgi:hypothetical protein